MLCMVVLLTFKNHISFHGTKTPDQSPQSPSDPRDIVELVTQSLWES